MAKTKKRVRRTDEELHPYEMFPYRLEFKEDGNNKICRFTHESHLHKYVERYRIKGAQVSAKKGWTLEGPPQKPKARKQPSRTKASQVTKTKKSTKPAATTKRTTTRSQNKKILEPLFSSLDSFHK
jgi:hypothetical protein